MCRSLQLCRPCTVHVYMAQLKTSDMHYKTLQTTLIERKYHQCPPGHKCVLTIICIIASAVY